MGDVQLTDEVLAGLEQAVIVRPGDTLIVRVPQNTPADNVARFMAAMRERLPDVPVVVIAAEDMVVYRPEPPLYTVELGDAASRAISDGLERASRAPEQRRRTG